MKRLFGALVVLLLVLGCASESAPESKFKGEDSPLPQESVPSKEESVPSKEVAAEALPKKGIIKFKSSSDATLLVLDMPVDIETTASGEFSYEIDENNRISGEGKGKTNFKVSSDIGIAKCSGKKEVQTTFKVAGIYDPKTNNLLIFTKDLKPEKETLDLDCPYEFGDLEYELELPILFFINSGGKKDLIIQHSDGALVNKKITHPVKDWDTSIEADWEFKLSLFSEFDFDVDVDPVSVSVVQGGTATPLVTVRLVRGTAENVALTVTKWQNINAYITNPTVTPTETTTLTIETSCDTPPDNYLFTVRGETSGTFRTSVDSVNVQVNKSPSCN